MTRPRGAALLLAAALLCAAPAAGPRAGLLGPERTAGVDLSAHETIEEGRKSFNGLCADRKSVV